MELAERLPVEIISVDSAQVYRGMDVGTAKPDAAARARVPHHLIDLIDPDQSYSAARFRSDALDAIAKVRARRRIPLLVGGTMLYFKALREGLSNLPPADVAVRARIDARAARGRLARTARRAGRCRSRRPRRGSMSTTPSAFSAHSKCSRCPAGRCRYCRVRARVRPRLSSTAVALIPTDRSLLHRNIASRFDAMLAAGLVDELQLLRRRYSLAATMASMRCVGYRQAWQFIDGDGDRSVLRERGIAATRQLAKRQLTWLRKTDATLIDCFAADVGARVYEAACPRKSRSGRRPAEGD